MSGPQFPRQVFGKLHAYPLAPGSLRFFRIESPRMSMRCALWTNRWPAECLTLWGR